MTKKEYERVSKAHPYLSFLIADSEIYDVELREENLTKKRLPKSYEIREAFISFFVDKVDKKEKKFKKLDLKKDLIESIRDATKYCEIFSVVVMTKTADGKKKMLIFNRPQKGQYYRAMEEILK